MSWENDSCGTSNSQSLTNECICPFHLLQLLRTFNWCKLFDLFGDFLKIFFVLRKMVENEIECVGSCVTSCCKETEELSDKFIFCVFIWVISIGLIEHIVFIKNCKKVFLGKLAIIKFLKLFINNLNCDIITY